MCPQGCMSVAFRQNQNSFGIFMAILHLAMPGDRRVAPHDPKNITLIVKYEDGRIITLNVFANGSGALQ